jgi:hypothetical protein
VTGAHIVAALDLPASCEVGRRIPKTLLIEQGALTGADKRQVNEGIERLEWCAVIKPDTAGVPEYRDESREYLEIAVLQVEFRPGAKRERLRELIHRAVPYPVVLAETHDGQQAISLAHKRFSLAATGDVVIDGAVDSCTLDPVEKDEAVRAFMAAMALGQQPRESMMSLYQAWLDKLAALQAAQITGQFREVDPGDEADALRVSLQRWNEIRDEMASLRSAAKKTKQMRRLSEINTRLQHLKARESETLTSL